MENALDRFAKRTARNLARYIESRAMLPTQRPTDGTWTYTFDNIGELVVSVNADAGNVEFTVLEVYDNDIIEDVLSTEIPTATNPRWKSHRKEVSTMKNTVDAFLEMLKFVTQ